MNAKIVALVAVVLIAGAGVGVVLMNNPDSKADIVIACGTKNCYEPFWIADHYGFFNEQGVNVEMQYVDGGGTATTVLMSGGADLTLVGADPAIRLFESVQGGYAIATIESNKSSVGNTDFAINNTLGIDLDNPTTFFNADGSIKIHCGLDTTTGYYSGYITYLYKAMEAGKITQEQFEKLKFVKTADTDGGIVHVSFDNQVASLLNNDVQMICSGNTVAIASEYPNISSTSSSYAATVGGVVLIVSDEAYTQKADALVKVLKALDKACEMIENPATVDEAASYCAEFYGATGWTEENQKNFFKTYYWDICLLTSMTDYLEEKAILLGYDNPDYSDLIKEDLVIRAHEGLELYDGKYIYDFEDGLI